MESKNVKSKELVCPVCGGRIEFTGDSDFDWSGEIFYYGECKGCLIEFRIYEDNNTYDLWYEEE